jgi:hypothetical protein
MLSRFPEKCQDLIEYCTHEEEVGNLNKGNTSHTTTPAENAPELYDNYMISPELKPDFTKSQ